MSENQNDTLDTRVDFTLIDSTTKHTGRVWGFCDGTNVYVKYNKASGLQIADNSFLKLHVGRYPFFSFKDRSSSPVILLPGFGLAGAVVGAASIGNAIAVASKPYSSKDYSLCIITSNGKLVKRPQVADVKALLANHPELLESFEKEYNNPSVVNYNSDDLDSEIYNLLKEYLFKLNEGYRKFIFH